MILCTVRDLYCHLQGQMITNCSRFLESTMVLYSQESTIDINSWRMVVYSSTVVGLLPLASLVAS